MKVVQVEPEEGFQVVSETKRSQAATMVLGPGRSVGGPENRHGNSDQWMYVTWGEGEARVGNRSLALKAGTLLLIEAGETHQISNTGSRPLKAVSFYAPPEYR